MRAGPLDGVPSQPNHDPGASGVSATNVRHTPAGYAAVVIGRRRSPRRTVEASPQRCTSPWWSRAALLCLALGLVLMHHLVGAHQHSDPAPAVMTSSLLPSQTTDHLAHGVGRTSEAGAAPAHGVVAASSPSVEQAGVAALATATGPTALLHEHHHGDDHSAVSMLLHMCLAVLAAAAFLVLALVAWWWRALPAAGHAVHLVVTVVPRAPPVSARLARLQVLRL